MWLLTDITEQSIRQCSVLSEFSCNASDEFTFRLKLIVSPPTSNMFGKRPIVDKLSAGGSWMDWIPCLQIQEFYFYLCSFSKALLTLQFEWENSCNLKDLCNITSWWTIVKLAFFLSYIRLFVFVLVFLYTWFFLHFYFHNIQITLETVWSSGYKIKTLLSYMQQAFQTGIFVNAPSQYFSVWKCTTLCLASIWY